MRTHYIACGCFRGEARLRIGQKDYQEEEHQLELHVKCATDKHAPIVRGSIVLPKGLKQEATILVFAEGKAAEDAKQAGAAIVGGAELVPRVQEGEFKFDKCLCTPAMLPAVAKIARYLGPKGLMPSVKKGTATDDIAAAVQASKSSFEYKSDRQGVVHTGIARLGFTNGEVEANIVTLLDSLKQNGAAGKKSFVQQVHISSTRGPGLLLKEL
ncbi:ribosomal protein L1-like protein [Thamnocephalis sphaerospora]|uniref:Ribosomal protein n=1 Tax=Thamnocephalis sphaerospora TaxID=78915 RepID=A0A4P9XP19_9FUNG|nr:ribosomal protein L1-like protein [Thamnocephalis sphaerospora]|eukprot:RKP07747.1 ribosomal protein L1-like protein [Thamnocephalis sphaerospora]